MVTRTVSTPQSVLCNTLGMAACTHPRKAEQKRCPECQVAYFREYRKTAQSRAVVVARLEGRDAALREACVMLLEVGDLQITGFKSAEMVRRLIGLD